jgi:DNA methylase
MPSLKTSACGTRAVAAWARSIAASTNSCSSLSTALRHTAITCISGNTGATGPMFGTIHASAVSVANPKKAILAALHPTIKPVAMVADAILDCSARGDIVLDPFLGSGTTIIAAERVGRCCYGMEIDPLYVDTIIRRWQIFTGDAAIHAMTGKRFDDLAREAEASHD